MLPDIRVLSLGTGYRKLPIKAGDWGLVQAARPMVGALMDTSVGSTAFLLRQVLGTRAVRVSVPLDEDYEMCDPAAVDRLNGLAVQFAQNGLTAVNSRTARRRTSATGLLDFGLTELRILRFSENRTRSETEMKRLVVIACLLVIAGGLAAVRGRSDATPAGTPGSVIPWPADLPVYDHVVIVVEENKDHDQVIGKEYALFINETLCKEGAEFTQIFGEEHHSQGNYFWLFSGSNHGVGFRDGVPDVKIKKAPNLGAGLIHKGLSFKGYSEDLPDIGSELLVASPAGKPGERAYARKHVPWISFDNVANKGTVKTSSNLRFKDFPTDDAGFALLPTVAIVIPNLKNDMHDSDEDLKGDDAIKQSVRRGDTWLKENLGNYYQWAKTHNSVLIVTWDESDDPEGPDKQAEVLGLTDPFFVGADRRALNMRNQIPTIIAGARVKPGRYDEGKGVTHVNVLRTLEAMYGLHRSGAQQSNAAAGGIRDDFIITDVFEKGK
jgi:hypothetical protein